MVEEAALGGELFDFITVGNRFDEATCRTYFTMLVEGLKYCHGRGVCHRDIKPENLLLSSEFVLKIGDFGQAALMVAGEFLTEKLGTREYNAPEIFTLKYKGDEVDLFSAGIVLFLMYSRHPPFEAANALDAYYRLIKDKKYEMFWEIHSKRKPAGFYTEKFKDLINGMFAFTPSERFSAEQILQHPWAKDGPVLTIEQIRQEF